LLCSASLYRRGPRRGLLHSSLCARVQLQNPAESLLMPGADDGDRRDEAIPAARESLDEARIFRGSPRASRSLFDRRSQTVVKVDDCVVAPQPVLNLIPGDHFAGCAPADKSGVEGLRLQADANAGFAQFSRFGICLEETEAKLVAVFS